MNYKKFYFILCVTVSLFLFVSGITILFYINKLNTTEGIIQNKDTIVSDILKPFVFGKDPVNFLVLIGDKEEANTDTMLLVNFNPSNCNLNILSIPRDTKVNAPGLKIPKANSLYSKKNGDKLVVETMEKMLDVNIGYYVYLNISTFRNIIDLLGGVEINVPIDMNYWDPTQNFRINLKKGLQRLDGEKAEQFLRYRQPNEGGFTEEILKYYDGSDIKRIKAQQYFMKELIRQKMNIIYLPKVNEIIDTVYSNIETNITMAEITKLLKSVSDFRMENVKMFTLPGEPRMDDEIWYFIYDKDESLKITGEYFVSEGIFADDSSIVQNSHTKKISCY